MSRSALLSLHFALACFFFLFYLSLLSFFFFFNDTATTEIYTLSLHDALPICGIRQSRSSLSSDSPSNARDNSSSPPAGPRSEEHTSELQSRLHLVCRLLLEKKKKKKKLQLQDTKNRA